MSISVSLSNALSGLSVTSRMAELASGNIANSLTPGYARRSLDTGSGFTGVRTYGVDRDANPHLTAGRRLAFATFSAGQKTLTTLQAVEQAIGAADAADGIAGRLAAFDAALTSAGADPSSDIRLANLTSSLGRLTDAINGAGDQIQQARQDADQAIARDVDKLNSGLQRIAEINADVSRSQAAGQDISSLLDARQQAIDSISGIVPLRILAREGDQLSLMSKSGMILLDGSPMQFEFSAVGVITAETTLASGGLSGISVDGAPVAPDGVGRLAGGSLEAAFTTRDEALVKAQSRLDAFALDLVQRFENPAVDPTVAWAGLLTDAGSAADPLDFTGLAGRLEINAVIDPKQGGSLSRWRDGVGAGTAGPTGDATQLNRWQTALSDRTVLMNGTAARSVADHAGMMVSQAGTDRFDAETSVSYSKARWETLHQSELAGGVDTDRELQDLLRIEQAYAANAKVMQTISAMMQQLMEI